MRWFERTWRRDLASDCVTDGFCANLRLNQVKMSREFNWLVFTVESETVTLFAVAVACKVDPNERILRKRQYWSNT